MHFFSTDTQAHIQIHTDFYNALSALPAIPAVYEILDEKQGADLLEPAILLSSDIVLKNTRLFP